MDDGVSRRDPKPEMKGYRVGPNAITYAWGETEAQWLERVQSAVERAAAAEAEVSSLRSRLDSEEGLRRLAAKGNVIYEKKIRELRSRLGEAEGLLRALVDDRADGCSDLGTCPYLARYESIEGHDPEATCAFGCHDEPECVTGTPSGGWPSFHAICFLSDSVTDGGSG